MRPRLRCASVVASSTRTEGAAGASGKRTLPMGSAGGDAGSGGHWGAGLAGAGPRAGRGTTHGRSALGRGLAGPCPAAWSGAAAGRLGAAARSGAPLGGAFSSHPPVNASRTNTPKERASARPGPRQAPTASSALRLEPARDDPNALPATSTIGARSTFGGGHDNCLAGWQNAVATVCCGECGTASSSSQDSRHRGAGPCCRASGYGFCHGGGSALSSRLAAAPWVLSSRFSSRSLVEVRPSWIYRRAARSSSRARWGRHRPRCHSTPAAPRTCPSRMKK